LLVGASGLFALLYAARDHPVIVWLPVILLVVSAVLAEWTQVSLPNGALTSLGFPLSIAASVLAGPFAAGLVAACSATGLNDLKAKPPLHKVVFNLGQLSLSAVLSGYAYVYLGGRVLYQANGSTAPLTGADFPEILLSLLALGAVAFAVNTALLSWVLSVERGISPMDVWSSGLAWAFPMQVALTFLGASIAQVVSIELFGLILFFFRWLYLVRCTCVT